MLIRCSLALPFVCIADIGSEFLCHDQVLPGRTKSSDWESRQVLYTPVSVNILRQRNGAAPHTVGPCLVKRFSFLKSLSLDVPEYQRDIEASRSVVENVISSQTRCVKEAI